MLPSDPTEVDVADPSITHRAYAAPLHYDVPEPRPLRFWIAISVASLGFCVMIAGTLVPDVLTGVAMYLAGMFVGFGTCKLAKLPGGSMNTSRYQLLWVSGALFFATLSLVLGMKSLKFTYVSFRALPTTWIFTLIAYYRITGALRANPHHHESGGAAG